MASKLQTSETGIGEKTEILEVETLKFRGGHGRSVSHGRVPPWLRATSASELPSQYYHDEEKCAFVRAAVEEADNVRMPELGDNVHQALELGAGEHDSWFHLGAVRAAEIAQGGLGRTGFE